MSLAHSSGEEADLANLVENAGSIELVLRWTGVEGCTGSLVEGTGFLEDCYVDAGFGEEEGEEDSGGTCSDDEDGEI